MPRLRPHDLSHARPTVGPAFIADDVLAAAERLRQGRLTGEIIERRYAADDPFVRPFLEVAAVGDEREALRVLANILSWNPRAIEHPYVLRQLRHLYTVFSVLDPDIVERALDARIKLIKAWAAGMTLGWKVSITKPPKGRRGQAPQYFPHLDDRDGWLPTEQATTERRDAAEFVQVYDALKTKLSKEVGWKALRQRSGADHLYTARKRIGATFEDVKSQAGISHPPLDPQQLMNIARAGFDEPKGRNPADRVARELLATLPLYTSTGAVLRLTPSGIKSTLKTLRKRGIPERSSSE